MSKASPCLSVSETATRLGVTPKALRVYEREGLVKPQRTAADWRVYGADELQRLHLVLALKSFGLTLSRIREIIEGGAELASILDMQEEVLSASKQRTDTALKLIKKIRAKLASGDDLSSDDIISLTKETVMPENKPSPEMERLIARHFSEAQKQALDARPWTQDDQRAASARWEALFVEAEALCAKGAADSSEAIEFARRWQEEAEKFTQRDPGLTASVSALYSEGFSKQNADNAMPMSKQVWEFMRVAQAALAASEDDGETIV